MTIKKGFTCLVSMFLALLVVVIPTSNVFAEKGQAVELDARVRDFKMEVKNDGHYMEYLTDIEGKEYKIIETISEDMKTVESKFYLNDDGNFILKNTQIQKISEDGKSYTVETIDEESEKSNLNIDNSIQEYKIEEPKILSRIEELELMSLDKTGISIMSNEYVWKQVGPMYTGSQGIQRNATVANIVALLNGVLMISNPFAGGLVALAREIYNINLQRFYYHGRTYRNYAGNRAKQSLHTYEDREHRYYIGNIIDEFVYYWD